MFKQVQVKEEKEQFNQIWADFCEESSIPFLNHCEKSYKYLIRDDVGSYVGTLEIGPFDKGHSNIEVLYPFSKASEIMKNEQKNFHEVSKLAIDVRYRGSGYFKRLIVLLAYHGQRYDVDYYIGIVNPRVYKYVRTMGYRIFPIGEKVKLSEEIEGIPFILDVKHGVQHTLQFTELRLFYQSINRHE